MRLIRLPDSDNDDCRAIIDHASLLCILLAQPDVDTAIDQMHRIAWLIINHARAIEAREQARAKQCA
jgi:hypothetical protein